MTPKTRKQLIQNLFPKEKSFRLKQIETALFQPEIMSWDQLSTLPLSMRQTLIKEIGFISVQIEKIFETADKETFKAILKLDDGQSIESVLMQNKRGHWTVCVSTQIGCAMGCSFCATGKMGLKRNLNSDEIIDQYRFWQKFLADHAEFDQQITNLVYMGMGEPLANYEEVKDSLNRILANTEIGPTRITVSTVGVLPRLQQILTDDEWPAVKIAISLHSADTEIRQSIMRSSYAEFLVDLAKWANEYSEKFGNRRHHLTFEYIMLRGVNDSVTDAKKLANYATRIGNTKVNLIPYNFTSEEYTASDADTVDEFLRILTAAGVVATVRRSFGHEIAAACGQLVVEN